MLFKLSWLNMLGNDVVDLRLAKIQSNWKRLNYLSKIYSPDEQHLIYASAKPDLMVWLLWSMKESAYKIVNRNGGLRFYNPKQFSCSLYPDGLQASGSVDYLGEKFLTYSEIDQNQVRTLSVRAGISLEQCKVIHTQNVRDYVTFFNAKYPRLKLGKNPYGLPEIYVKSTMTRHTASVSHHGDFLFIAYLSAGQF